MSEGIGPFEPLLAVAGGVGVYKGSDELPSKGNSSAGGIGRIFVLLFEPTLFSMMPIERLKDLSTRKHQ